MATKNRLDFKEAVKRLEKQKSDLPKRVANDALNYFEDSFRKERWDGKKWPEVKRRQPGTPEYKYPKSVDLNRRVRGILQGKTRRLLLAVKNSLRSVTWRQIRFGVDRSYAAYQNEGTSTIPKRKFIGNSRELQKKLSLRIHKAIKGIF